MAFADQDKIMFTQELLDVPTAAWEVTWSAGDGQDRIPVSIKHKASQHVWALTLNEGSDPTTYTGKRVDGL